MIYDKCCTKCGVKFNEDNYVGNTWCRECNRLHSIEYRMLKHNTIPQGSNPKIINIDGKRKCFGCNLYKSIDLFKVSNKNGHLRNYCNKCKHKLEHFRRLKDNYKIETTNFSSIKNLNLKKININDLSNIEEFIKCLIKAQN